MLDDASLYADLARIGLQSWQEPLAPLIRERLSDRAHGDLKEWRKNVEALGNDTAADRALLKRLSPWRKGPFRIGDIEIDAEWRSDLKWARLENEISPLDDRLVLDVGCGNGYYTLRMLDAGASMVIGIDPTVLFVCQFAAISKLLDVKSAHVLPLRLEDLPPGSAVFDTTFSMGVLSHRKDRSAHLEALRETLRPGGELVLETLVFPGEEDEVFEPGGRYANMRNVWRLPTVAALRRWLAESGFTGIRLVDVTMTTVEEQRSTEWMPFHSLSDALDPDNPTLTIEGHPAPTRAILVAEKF